MRKLEVRLDWGDEQVVVGRLAEQERRVYFEYDGTFVANPLPISPFKLPVRPGLFEHGEPEFAIVDGELFVTAAPRPGHQDVVANLVEILRGVARRHGLGKVLPGLPAVGMLC